MVEVVLVVGKDSTEEMVAMVVMKVMVVMDVIREVVMREVVTVGEASMEAEVMVMEVVVREANTVAMMAVNVVYTHIQKSANSKRHYVQLLIL